MRGAASGETTPPPGINVLLSPYAGFNTPTGMMTCTGVVRHAPGTVGSEAIAINCTNGAHGTAVLAKNGRLLSFNLLNGTGGYVTF